MINGRVAALCGVPAAFVAGAIAARTWLAHARPPVNDLAQPLVVVTAWGAAGAGAFGILAATIAAATLTLLVAVQAGTPQATPGDRVGCERKRAVPSPGTTLVIAVAALALLAAGTWPFVFSSDVYAYAAYADLAVRGADPYRSAPLGLHDAFVDAARWQWSGSFPPDVYGPAMLAITRGIFSAAHAYGVAVTLTALRICAALAFLTSIALLGLLLDRWEARRRFIALCAYGLNPAILWSVAEGHNDAFLLCFAGFALLPARAGFPIAAGFTLGLSPLLKAPGLLLAFGFALDTLLRRHVRRVPIVAATAVGLGLAVALSLPPLLPTLHHVERQGRYAPGISLQSLLGPLPVLGLALLALGTGAVRLSARRREGYAWLGLAVALSLPNLYPWYALWLVPWAIAAQGGRVATALWGVTIFAVLRYFPDAVGALPANAAHIVAIAAALPFLLAFLNRGQVPRPEKVTAST